MHRALFFLLGSAAAWRIPKDNALPTIDGNDLTKDNNLQLLQAGTCHSRGTHFDDCDSGCDSSCDFLGGYCDSACDSSCDRWYCSAGSGNYIVSCSTCYTCPGCSTGQYRHTCGEDHFQGSTSTGSCASCTNKPNGYYYTGSGSYNTNNCFFD